MNGYKKIEALLLQRDKGWWNELCVLIPELKNLKKVPNPLNIIKKVTLPATLDLRSKHVHMITTQTCSGWLYCTTLGSRKQQLCRRMVA
jgi:hypothetical protein